MTKRILITGGSGYIGSALSRYLKKSNKNITIVDLKEPDRRYISNFNQMRYQDLIERDVSKFDVVIHLAAHADVKSSVQDPRGAFYNNVVGFHDFLEKIDQDQLFIYASSASIYNGSKNTKTDEEWIKFNPGNMYDFSKYTNDILAKFSNKKTVGLRFGTVNGPSPNMRWDLVVNKMTHDATKNKKLFVSNGHINRSILGIDDLSRAIETIIDSNQKNNLKYYNLSSFNTTIIKIAENVKSITGAEIVTLPDSSAYDFRMCVKNFCKDFSFQFTNTHKSIITDLLPVVPNYVE
jgi:nucleoside-diphosphate-sugar epimerase